MSKRRFPFSYILMLACGLSVQGATLADKLTPEALRQGAATLEAGVWTTGDFTVPAGFQLNFAPGAVIQIEPDAVLTVNGAIAAAPRQIFSGPGKVTGRPEVPAVFPEWFGARGDDRSDDTAALQQAALLAANAQGRTLVLGPKRYCFSGDIVIRCHIDCQGVLVNRMVIDESKTADRFRNHLLFYYPARPARLLIEPDTAPIPLDASRFYGVRKDSFKIPQFSAVPRLDRPGETVDLEEGGTLRFFSTDFFTARRNNRNDEHYNKEDVCFLASPAGDVFPEFNFDYLKPEQPSEWQADAQYRKGDYARVGKTVYKAVLASGPQARYTHFRHGTAAVGPRSPAAGTRQKVTYDNGKSDMLNFWVRQEFRVEYVPPQPPLFLRGLQMEISRADAKPERTSVHTQSMVCRRSGVTFDRMRLACTDGRVLLYNLITLTNCVRNVFNNCTFSGALMHGMGYNVMEHNVGCTTFNQCISVNSRDGLAARHGKNITVNGGHYNRIDDHYGRNYVIRDVVFHCVSTALPGHWTAASDIAKQTMAPSHGVVYSGENITIENCIFYRPRSVLCTRMDTADFGGKVVLRDITVVSDRDALIVWHEVAPDFDYAHKVKMPHSVLIDNATITAPHKLTFKLTGVDPKLYTVRGGSVKALPGMRVAP